MGLVNERLYSRFSADTIAAARILYSLEIELNNEGHQAAELSAHILFKARLHLTHPENAKAYPFSSVYYLERWLGYCLCDDPKPGFRGICETCGGEQ